MSELVARARARYTAELTRVSARYSVGTRVTLRTSEGTWHGVVKGFEPNFFYELLVVVADDNGGRDVVGYAREVARA